MDLPAFRSMLFVLLAATATQGCAAEPDDDAGVAADEEAVSVALPIKGEWALVQWQGHYAITQGSQVELHRVRKTFDARAREGAAMLDLAPSGDGTIRGLAHCRPSFAPGTSTQGLPASPIGDPMEVAKGVLTILGELQELVDTARCDPTRAEEKTVYTYPKRTFFGQPSQELNANLGVYAEGGGSRAAEKECRALRGVRWMSLLDGTVACAGYADAAARTVKMLVQQPGEIYVQRLVLRRPSDP